MSRKTSTMR